MQKGGKANAPDNTSGWQQTDRLPLWCKQDAVPKGSPAERKKGITDCAFNLRDQDPVRCSLLRSAMCQLATRETGTARVTCAVF